jgi:hypothetical protein
MSDGPSLIPPAQIEQVILLIRGQRVMLDRDLAALYGVETKNLNKAVRRNCDRFPPDFMFQLTADEADRSRFQFGTLKRGQNLKYLPQAFTQEGVAMLSSVLRSPRASSLSAPNGETLRCRNGHFAVQPVTASWQRAAFLVCRQTRDRKDSGALPSRRYAGKTENALERFPDRASAFAAHGSSASPVKACPGSISLHQLVRGGSRTGECGETENLLSFFVKGYPVFVLPPMAELNQKL